MQMKYFSAFVFCQGKYSFFLLGNILSRQIKRMKTGYGTRIRDWVDSASLKKGNQILIELTYNSDMVISWLLWEMGIDEACFLSDFSLYSSFIFFLALITFRVYIREKTNRVYFNLKRFYIKKSQNWRRHNSLFFIWFTIDRKREKKKFQTSKTGPRWIITDRDFFFSITDSYR